MTYIELIQKALPGISHSGADYILWNRTAFPFDNTPRKLIKSATGFVRASRNGHMLCDHCCRKVESGWICEKCAAALLTHAE